jgi:hypothetical protein
MTKGTMASSARLVMERALRNGTYNLTMAQTKKSAKSNATGLLIQELVFAESKSVRTSTIILAVFNILAAFATACSILYDCYSASKRCNPKFKASYVYGDESEKHVLIVRRKFCIRTIHPAETFPLILAIGIVIQGIVFAAVQGQGLRSLFTNGCSITAQFMWPGKYIVEIHGYGADEFSTFHCAIYSICFRNRMCRPFFTKSTVPGEGKTQR